MAYATPVGAGAAPSTVQASANDRVTLMGYDVLQRLTVQVDQSGVVSRQSFDANGNVVSTVTYAKAVTAPVAGSTIALADQAVLDTARDHVVRSVFDSADREIYRIDGTGAVLAMQYDANGNMTGRVAYASTIDAGTAATEGAIAAAVAPPASSLFGIGLLGSQLLCAFIFGHQLAHLCPMSIQAYS